MTYAYLGGQLALLSRYVSVWGGRLTTFKDQMADITPSLSVMASATVQGRNAVRSAEQGHGFITNVTDPWPSMQRSAELQRAYVEKDC